VLSVIHLSLPRNISTYPLKESVRFYETTSRIKDATFKPVMDLTTNNVARKKRIGIAGIHSVVVGYEAKCSGSDFR
jgi:hypothetical protein